MVADLLSPNRCHWWIAKVKNYDLNVTKGLISDFKNAFFGFSISPSGSYPDHVLEQIASLQPSRPNCRTQSSFSLVVCLSFG